MRTLLYNTFSFGLALCVAPVAFAQSGNDGGECSGGLCGAPNQTGGGGGCGGGGGSILINFTDVGDTYQYADDYDSDGFEDDFDNCPFAANFEQGDADGDLVGDVCDSCVNFANPDQADADADGAGDACDADIDNDGFLNQDDNCPFIANPSQTNTDGDAEGGNACDSDDDNDGVPDTSDTCALVPNIDQSIIPNNALCDLDQDGDSIPDSIDNCPLQANNQADDIDGDSIGDACDVDIDGDGWNNFEDNCPNTANVEQIDDDRDLQGNACDSRLCYVIRRVEDIAVGAPIANPNHCLDPDVTFTVLSLPYDVVEVGQERLLQIFANRDDRVLRYEWRVISRPDGSSAGVRNATGTASQEDERDLLLQYNYVDRPATFTPDEPGEYELELRAELVGGDDRFPQASTDVTRFTLTAEGESAGGCATLPGQTNTTVVWMLGLAGVALVLRRRRA
jgi:uncharacterized protein (TIGR03382 family)